MGIKLMSILMLQVTLVAISRGVPRNGSSSKQNFGPKFAVKSIQSEDGDVIDCIGIHNQPAFNHPALRNHKIQMRPTYDPIMVTKNEKDTREASDHKGNKDLYITTTAQIWHKSGSCPEGTIPIRRVLRKNKSKGTTVDDHARKKPTISPYQFNDNKNMNLLQANHSLAILHTEGYAYFGAKGDIKVCYPSVELDDEYTTSQVALKSGPYNQYEALESGWAVSINKQNVNPSVYGDRQTRFFTYWTIDASVETGCFDATCPGFVQISKDIALGAAIYPISKPNELPYQITIFIFKDPFTGNWWVNYGDKVYIGYWPGELFDRLSFSAETVQWGGEVYSARVGTSPHTATQMGNGEYADRHAGTIRRMRVVQNSQVIKFPDWVNSYTDEYNCYDARYRWEFLPEPEFYYGGPGRSYMCP
ncbi:protein neprosin isoform X1 [Coffea arabica]|uniref:Protein neprosin isoform X1 n=1 Tax=Coffea arabica TaxID=13443 RepID=A0ABM4VGE8_COFAR